MFKFKKIDTEEIAKKINEHNKVKRYAMLLTALFVSAVVYNLLIIPSNLVIGGANGVAVITRYIYHWDPAITVFFICVSMMILSLMYLGKEVTKGVVVATFVYPLFVELTSPISKYLTITSNDLIVVAIFVGVLTGICHGVMYKSGYSQGGLPILSQIFHKYFKVSISTSSLIINSIIVFLGGFFFGWTMMMYSLIVIYINSLMVDKVLLGISANKAFYIITNKEKEVKEFIMEELHHSVTVFDVKGGFKNRKGEVLLTVIPTREYYVVTEGIKMIDKDAFFLASDAYQVEGGK
ncbi:MAG: YitT family protein [Bacilli bacterium]|nr:YitT family protein [Bacilli bacterium]